MCYTTLVKSATANHGRFPSTRWTLVVQAAQTISPDSQQALEELCRTYWPPLYAFLRRSGSDNHEAKDIVQGYLARLLERQDLRSVAPAHGRFRSYLLAGLRNFLASEYRRETAQKRGGGAVLSLETEGLGAEAFFDRDGVAPDEAYDRSWAETVLRRALHSLQAEYTARGRSALFDVLKPALTGDTADDHATWGGALGMTSGAVAVAVHRLRLRLRELVRLEVAQTVHDPADIDEEMRTLKSILSE
jgi:RNA polymerase sigma-70 factor (ECF subfamily)